MKEKGLILLTLSPSVISKIKFPFMYHVKEVSIKRQFLDTNKLLRLSLLQFECSIFIFALGNSPLYSVELGLGSRNDLITLCMYRCTHAW